MASVLQKLFRNTIIPYERGVEYPPTITCTSDLSDTEFSVDIAQAKKGR